ncbi:holo-ACP synthase [Zoogloea sp.]|uniref:holo-ACP synthase n=1 Tax=Zoogloea sp. TaxID=49181 RepID=UPI0035B1E828|nr:holo-ACP synthase [Rhodocyclales bacterium]
MIFGVGTDIVRVARLQDALARHGERFAARLLDASELDDYRRAPDPARFLAKRFAAKEAFGKALGTGVAEPATLHAVRVAHDPRGKPLFAYGPALAEHMRAQGLHAHLSLSDEAEYVVAFAVIEHLSAPSV